MLLSVCLLVDRKLCTVVWVCCELVNWKLCIVVYVCSVLGGLALHIAYCVLLGSHGLEDKLVGIFYVDLVRKPMGQACQTSCPRKRKLVSIGGEEHMDELNVRDEELKGEVQEMVRETLEVVTERNAQLESVLDILRREMEELRAKVSTTGVGGGLEATTRPEFYPEYAMDEVRGKLLRLVQRGEIREYVREFSELALQVGDLGEREALFAFIDGLKPWAKQKLQRRGIKARVGQTRANSLGTKKVAMASHSNNEKVKNCPKCFKLVAIASEKEQQPVDVVKLSSMLLRTVNKTDSRAKWLMYADMVVASQHVEALVDTGVSDLYVSKQGVAKFSIKADITRGKQTFVALLSLEDTLSNVIKALAEVLEVLPSWGNDRGNGPGITKLGYAVRIDECSNNVLHFDEQVFEVLRQHELYVKKEKCYFGLHEVPFLGHIIKDGKILMDPSKVSAIQEWESPTKVKELRSFLGLANNYRRFIGGYSAIAAPLTDMLKKKYKPSKVNLVADALSRKATLAAISKVRAELLPRIREGMTHDLTSQFILEHAKDKVEQQRLRGLLNTLPVQEKPWDSVSMDFIMKLPKADRFNNIMEVVDRFSKYVTFISTTKEFPIKEVARLFLRHIVNNHPQIDGQAEQVNALLELYLRHFVQGTPIDWLRQQPHMASTIAVGYTGPTPTTYKTTKGLEEQYEGPYRVVKRIGKVAYKLDMLLKLTVHLVFHISMLKPYHGDEGNLSRGVSHRAPLGLPELGVCGRLMAVPRSNQGLPHNSKEIINLENPPFGSMRQVQATQKEHTILAPRRANLYST
ncbi:Uncharacterized protein TCM_039559 [Theobroma cacao]|uniref:Uncharacterized protein n=1 Tax=Theobroma cacao TaxID=3641 RepID=A0A061GRD5_THECC|nr:Uncharacterized protein TCM_039559 [Theobroma cacao]